MEKFVCPDCKGKPKLNKYSGIKELCLTCFNEGELDWIDNIMGCSIELRKLRVDLAKQFEHLAFRKGKK